MRVWIAERMADLRNRFLEEFGLEGVSWIAWLLAAAVFGLIWFWNELVGSQLQAHINPAHINPESSLLTLAWAIVILYCGCFLFVICQIIDQGWSEQRTMLLFFLLAALCGYFSWFFSPESVLFRAVYRVDARVQSYFEHIHSLKVGLKRAQEAGDTARQKTCQRWLDEALIDKPQAEVFLQAIDNPNLTNDQRGRIDAYRDHVLDLFAKKENLDSFISDKRKNLDYVSWTLLFCGLSLMVPALGLTVRRLARGKPALKPTLKSDNNTQVYMGGTFIQLIGLCFALVMASGLLVIALSIVISVIMIAYGIIFLLGRVAYPYLKMLIGF
jgi:hypothetical protein